MHLEWMDSRQEYQKPDAHKEQEWHGQAGKPACVSFNAGFPVGKMFHQVRAPFLVRFPQKQDALAASPVSSALLPPLREQAANSASVAALCEHAVCARRGQTTRTTMKDQKTPRRWKCNDKSEPPFASVLCRNKAYQDEEEKGGIMVQVFEEHVT